MKTYYCPHHPSWNKKRYPTPHLRTLAGLDPWKSVHQRQFGCPMTPERSAFAFVLPQIQHFRVTAMISLFFAKMGIAELVVSYHGAQ